MTSGVPSTPSNARDLQGGRRFGRAGRSGWPSRSDVRADVEHAARGVVGRDDEQAVRARRARRLAFASGEVRDGLGARNRASLRSCSVFVTHLEIPSPLALRSPGVWASRRSTRGETPRWPPRRWRSESCRPSVQPASTPWQNAPPNPSPAPRPLTTSTATGGTWTRSSRVLASTPSGPSLTTAITVRASRRRSAATSGSDVSTAMATSSRLPIAMVANASASARTRRALHHETTKMSGDSRGRARSGARRRRALRTPRVLRCGSARRRDRSPSPRRARALEIGLEIEFVLVDLEVGCLRRAIEVDGEVVRGKHLAEGHRRLKALARRCTNRSSTP